MNWSRSWSKVCDSDRIVPGPSRSASGPWCWVGRSVMFLFDCWLAGWPFMSNPWCGSSVAWSSGRSEHFNRGSRRADIKGSKSNVAMNAWLSQACYPCCNFSDTSSFKF
ncbi:unnamed protein product [Brassica rapa]|uniref:Uncharacterized protein n=1 Tax=Brassica campestris TaxID=3711 RepID=A0A8D9D7J1_BRACM|nr:unnamed protein product [Brassica rapa]